MIRKFTSVLRSPTRIILRSISTGLLAFMLFAGITVLASPSAHAAAAIPSVLACHTNAYEVQYANGSYVQASMYYKLENDDGTLTVSLWYCPNYQSNFARATWYPVFGAAATTIDTEIQVNRSDGATTNAYHNLLPRVSPTNGSQDSPTIYAPTLAAQACLPDFFLCTGWR